MVDRLTSDLTIEQLQRIIANHESDVQLTGVAMYRQLLATMQREAKLREALKEIIICVWSDNFKDSDAKLDAIDERAEHALSSECSDDKT